MTNPSFTKTDLKVISDRTHEVFHDRNILMVFYDHPAKHLFHVVGSLGEHDLVRIAVDPTRIRISHERLNCVKELEEQSYHAMTIHAYRQWGPLHFASSLVNLIDAVIKEVENRHKIA